MTVAYCGPQWLEPLCRRWGLKSFDRVTTLWLGGPEVTDQCVPQICALRELKTLTLSNTRLTPAGLYQLRRRLQDCEVQSPQPLATAPQGPISQTAKWTAAGWTAWASSVE